VCWSALCIRPFSFQNVLDRLGKRFPLGLPAFQLFGTRGQETIVLALGAITRYHQVALDVAEVLQTAQEGIDAALTYQIQPLLGQLLHHLVAIAGPFRNRREQAHIQSAFK
jgi:hypothetical protein